MAWQPIVEMTASQRAEHVAEGADNKQEANAVERTAGVSSQRRQRGTLCAGRETENHEGQVVGNGEEARMRCHWIDRFRRLRRLDVAGERPGICQGNATTRQRLPAAIWPGKMNRS